MTEAVKEKPKIDVKPDTVSFTIDGKSLAVPKGTTVFDAAKQMGIAIPAFCNHPKLKPVGACRMCYVEIEKMPKLQVSCATLATDGMVVHTNSNKVKDGRKAVLEFTLINHPLDCPTCDKGGECDLQDLTFAHGYDDSRFEFGKMRFTEGGEPTTFDDVQIGPEIVLNRNRCILCYKCVRANKEAFGEYDLGAFERGNITEINAAPGEQVNNPYSGNLVEICPVGALTNTDWRYKIRVWLTKTTPSICNFTASGANLLFWKEDHQNKIFRVTSRRNDSIDDGWLCDITRYGYQMVNSPDRLKTPLIKKGGRQVPSTWEEALELIKERLGEIKDKSGGVCIGGLINPGLDNASLHSFSKFLRAVLKSNNVDYRGEYRFLPATGESPFLIAASRPFRISEIESSDVIVTFGTDLIREHQNEYLKIRRAYNFNHARIFSLTPYAVRTADIAQLQVVYRPGTDEAVLSGICLAAIENGLVDSSRDKGLKEKLTPNNLNEISKLTGVDVASFIELARALAGSKKISFIAGDLVARSLARDKIGAALANLNKLFGIEEKGQMAVLARYANSKGAEKLGLAAEPAPIIKKHLQGLWPGQSESPSKNTDAMMALMKKEEIKGLIAVGVNPVRMYPDREFAAEGLERVDFMVACDLFETETTALADVVLPMCSWAEYEGEYVNLEGKIQNAQRAVKPLNEAKPAYEIIDAMAEQFERKLFQSDEERKKEITAILQLDSAMDWPNEFLPIQMESPQIEKEYPYPLFICDDPHHCGHLTEKSPSLLNFCSEAYLELSAALAKKLNIDDGDSVKVESPVGRIIVPVKISQHLDNDIVLIPHNFGSTTATSLLMRKKRIDSIRITKLEK